jgi:hypothetical protein
MCRYRGGTFVVRLDGESPVLGRKGYFLFAQPTGRTVMNRVALAVALSCAVFSGAIAADETCKSQADAKKLAGAALTSFLKKCESDAQTTCDKQAADKKIIRCR